MNDVTRPSKDRVAELREQWQSRVGSQKGQYRMKHADVGLLFSLIDSLNHQLSITAGVARQAVAEIHESVRAAHEPRAPLTDEYLKQLAVSFDSTGAAGAIHHYRFRHRDLLAMLRNLAATVEGMLRDEASFPGHGNATTAADRPIAIPAGEAAASDGDSACPAVPTSELAALKKYHAEIVECDGAECEAMRLTRWAIETIERAAQPPLPAHWENTSEAVFVKAAADAGFSDKQWKAMFYEQGPYDITLPTFTLRKFVRLMAERCSIATKGEG